MTMDYDTKGKFFTNVIAKDAVKARIQTTSHLIEGEIHVRHDCRLKDELDIEETFLAVTNANVYNANHEKLFHTHFLAIQRDQIVWVTLTEDIDEGESNGS